MKILPPSGTTILLLKKTGTSPFDWNFRNEKTEIQEVEAKVLSESKMCVLVELKEYDNIGNPIKCNIPKRLFTSKGSNLEASPPTISLPIGFNISLVNPEEEEYINPLNIEQMETGTPTKDNFNLKTKETTPLIYSKILATMMAVKAIGKNQTATDKDFSFRGIDDITNSLHPLFQEQSIFLTSDVLSHQINNVGKTIVNVKFTFYTSDGSSVSSSVCGESVEKGEHGTAKAISYALKTALCNMFLIPTDDREWLTKKQMTSAILRINKGEKDLLDKIKSQYRIKNDYLKMLEEAIKKLSKK